MLAAPAVGPSIKPASTTTRGWSVKGTGVPGIGIVICAAAASATAKPTTPKIVDGLVWRIVVAMDVISILPFDAEGDGVTAAKAEGGESGSSSAIRHGVQ